MQMPSVPSTSNVDGSGDTCHPPIDAFSDTHGVLLGQHRIGTWLFGEMSLAGSLPGTIAEPYRTLAASMGRGRRPTPGRDGGFGVSLVMAGSCDGP